MRIKRNFFVKILQFQQTWYEICKHTGRLIFIFYSTVTHLTSTWTVAVSFYKKRVGWESYVGPLPCLCMFVYTCGFVWACCLVADNSHTSPMAACSCPVLRPYELSQRIRWIDQKFWTIIICCSQFWCTIWCPRWCWRF